jgi:chromosome segregation ATPase
VHAQKTHVYVPSEDFASLLEAKLRLAEQDVVVDHLRDQYNAVMEEITKRNIFLKERWAADAVQTTSKENVVDVLTQKVCVLETLVRELTEERDLADRLVRATRAAAANEITNVRKELLEETQKLRHKLDTATVVQHSLNEAIARKDKETDHLKQQLEFLLGLGLRATNNVVTQTD